MQVNHASDHITHAVIGAKNAEELQISQTAEFFQILSSTLYSDKPMAVVREVLCNAWDAHIEAGKTDTAIQVKLDNEKLTIRDFGPGIPDADIIRIYGTYGGSTKAANNNVTGGFGLGCKSPFAYTDHFELISCHEGIKTVYRMALSAAQLGGKPSIMKIMSMPTDESGISVGIDLKSHHDYSTFRNNIRLVTRLGEMKVSLDGHELETLEFSKAKHPFVFIRKSHISLKAPDISVRCGNVVYPVEIAPEYADIYNKLISSLRTISGDNGWSSNREGWGVVLLAPAGSISPTPSRESVSLTPRTVAILEDLLEQANSMLNGTSSNINLSLDILKQEIDRITRKGQAKILLTSDMYYPRENFIRRAAATKMATTAEEVAQISISVAAPKVKGFAIKEFKQRVQAVVASGLLDKGKARSLLREVVKQNKTQKNSSWIHRNITWPLFQKLTEAGLPTRNLVTVHNPDYCYRNEMFKQLSSQRYPSASGALPFFRKMIVISYNRTAIYDRIRRYDKWNEAFKTGRNSNYEGAIGYICPRNKDTVDKVKKLFESQGYTVIDLTVVPAWEAKQYNMTSDQVKIAPTNKPAVPRKKGIPLLKAFRFAGRFVNFNINFSDIENSERSTTPEAVLKVGRREQSSLGTLGSDGTAYVLEHFSDKIGIVNTQASYDKMIEAKIPSFHDWIGDRLAEVGASKEVLHAKSVDYDAFGFDQIYTISKFPKRHVSYENKLLYDCFFRDPVLNKEFDLPEPATPSGKASFGFWDSSSSYQYHGHTEYQKTVKLMDDTKPHPKMVAFFDKILDSKLMSIIDSSSAYSKLISDAVSDSEKDLVRNILRTVIKG